MIGVIWQVIDKQAIICTPINDTDATTQNSCLVLCSVSILVWPFYQLTKLTLMLENNN